MRTTKPISTISFNTSAFLRLKLNELTSAGILSFWAFVEHQPEDDEGGRKVHHHLYVEPSKMLQTDEIRHELLEPDPDNEKPRGCLTWNSSKFADWYLYSKHDSSYLASKGQSRKYEYRHEAFYTSDSDDLLFKVKSIDITHLTPFQAMREAQDIGLTFAEYFSMGKVPLPQVKLFESAWNLLASGDVYRNTKPNHPMDTEVYENDV